ncbi:hypothetical protein [Kineococcus glutinatus]
MTGARNPRGDVRLPVHGGHLSVLRRHVDLCRTAASGCSGPARA